MDKYEMRRLRLIELMNARCNGKASEIAKRIDRSESYVSRMMYPEGKAGKKRIGEDMADLITQAFELPPYWLDGDLAPISASPQAREVARAFDKLSEKQKEAVMIMIETYGPTISRLPAPPRDVTAIISEQQTSQGNLPSENRSHKQSFGSS